MGNALNNSGVRGGGVAPSLKAFGTADFGGIPLPGSTPVGTTGQPAAGTAALHEQIKLPNVAEITSKFGGADRLRNAVNQLQSLLYAAALREVVAQTHFLTTSIVANVEIQA
jgi:hypothetical protein